MPNEENTRLTGRWALDRRQFGTLLALLPSMSARPAAASWHERNLDPFVIYYGSNDDPEIGRYGLAVLDADVEPAALRHRDTTVLLGYLSMGEVDSFRSYYPEVQSEGILGSTNPNWPDARFVDLRDPRWHRRVVEDLVPAILSRGFHGIFLDTLDNAEHLQSVKPGRFAGTIDATVDLMHALRRSIPGVPIMVNRGYALLPRITGQFDMLLGESVRAAFNGKDSYVLLPDRDYKWQRSLMWKARERDPNLGLFSLDYWDPNDKAGIAALHATQRANGFNPYVSTRDLSKIVAPP
jgi:polysaccharide biosynthesis protein PelA